MEQAGKSGEQADAAEEDKDQDEDMNSEDDQEWFTLERLEAFATHLQATPILWRCNHVTLCNKKSGRAFAYRRLMDALGEMRGAQFERRVAAARRLCHTFFKLLRQKLKYAAQEAVSRGVVVADGAGCAGGAACAGGAWCAGGAGCAGAAGGDVCAVEAARALLPAWARRADQYLLLLHNYLKCGSGASVETAAGRRLLRRVARGMRAAAAAHGGLTRRAAAALAHKLNDDPDHIYELWCSMRSLATAKLRALLARGDMPPPSASTRMSARDWAVADLMLLYDYAIVCDADFQQYSRLRALLSTFHLVQRFRLQREPPAAPAPPRAWLAAARWYSRNHAVMSAVALQKRWHEMAQDTRVRLRAHLWSRGTPSPTSPTAPPAVLPLHHAIARRYPHIVTATMFEPWRKLVALGQVAPVTSPRGPAPGDPPSARLPRDSESSTDSDTVNPEDDDDLILVERTIETIDLSEDEGVSDKVQPRTIKRSKSDDIPIIETDSCDSTVPVEDASTNINETETPGPNQTPATNINGTGSDKNVISVNVLNKETTEAISEKSNSAPDKIVALTPKPVLRNWFEKTVVVNKVTVPDKDLIKNGTDVSKSGSGDSLDLNTNVKTGNVVVSKKDSNSLDKNIDFNKEVLDVNASSPQAEVLNALQDLDTCGVEAMILFDSEEEDNLLRESGGRSLKMNLEQSDTVSGNANKLSENNESHSINYPAQDRSERKSSDSSEGHLIIDHIDDVNIENDHSSGSHDVTKIIRDANVKTIEKETVHDRDKPTSSRDESNITESGASNNSDVSDSNKNTPLQQMLINDEVEQLNTLKVHVTKVAKVYENKKKSVGVNKTFNKETVSVMDVVSENRIEEYAKNKHEATVDTKDATQGADVDMKNVKQEAEKLMNTNNAEVDFDPKLLMVPIVALKRFDDEVDLRTEITSPSPLSLLRSVCSRRSSSTWSASSRCSLSSSRSISPSASIPSLRSGTSHRSIATCRSMPLRNSPRRLRNLRSSRTVSRSGSVSSLGLISSGRSVALRRSVSPRKPSSDASQSLEQSFLDKNKGLLKQCRPCSVTLKRVEAGSFCGSERSRVTKKVELPNIEEVRRNNRTMLTAQVAPLSLRQYASASGSSTEDASSEEEWSPDGEGRTLVIDTDMPATAAPAERQGPPPEPTATNLQHLLDDLAGVGNGEDCRHDHFTETCARCVARALAAPPTGPTEARLQRRLLKRHSAAAMKDRPNVKKSREVSVHRRRASPSAPAGPAAKPPPPRPRPRQRSPPDPERDAREWQRQKNIGAEKFGLKPRCLKRVDATPELPAAPPASAPAGLLPSVGALYGEPGARLYFVPDRHDLKMIVKEASGAAKVLPLTEENLRLHGQPVMNVPPGLLDRGAVADIHKKPETLPEPAPAAVGFGPVITCVQSLALGDSAATLAFNNRTELDDVKPEAVQKYVIIPSQLNKPQGTETEKPLQSPPPTHQIKTVQTHASPTAHHPTLPRVIDVTGNVNSTNTNQTGGLHLIVSPNHGTTTPHIVVDGNIITGNIVNNVTSSSELSRPVNALQVNSVQAGPSPMNTFIFTSVPSAIPNQFVINSQPNMVVNSMPNLVLSPMVQSQNQLVMGAVQQATTQALPMVVRSVQAGPPGNVVPHTPVIVNAMTVPEVPVETAPAQPPSTGNEVEPTEKEKPPESPLKNTKDEANTSVDVMALLRGDAAPVRAQRWAAGRDPARLRVLAVGDCWLLLQQYLVVCEEETPPERAAYFSISPRVRLILPDEEDAPSKQPPAKPSPPAPPAEAPRLRVKSFARIVEPEPAEETSKSEEEERRGEEARSLVAPTRVHLSKNRVYQKLGTGPLVYAKVLSAVRDARAARALVARGAALQLYCLRTSRLYPLKAEATACKDGARVTLSGDEEVSPALVSLARQLYSLHDPKARVVKRPSSEPQRKLVPLAPLTTLERVPADESTDDAVSKGALPPLKRYRVAPNPRLLNHVVAKHNQPTPSPQKCYRLLLPGNVPAPVAIAPAPPATPATPATPKPPRDVIDLLSSDEE